MTLGVDPQAVVGDPVPLVTALVEGLQVTQDLGEVIRWVLPRPRMIGTPRQSSSSLTTTRTVSSRQIRQRGSLRSMSALTGSAALVIVLIRKWW